MLNVLLGANPQSLAYDPLDKKMFVTLPGQDQVDVFNATKNQLVMEFGGTGDFSLPYGIVYDQLNGEIYVANAGWNSVSVIDPNTYSLIANISLGQTAPQAVTYSNATGYVYVANYANDSVSVIDSGTNRVVGSPITVGSGPEGIAYDPSNQDIYVTNSKSGTVTVISNASSVVATVNVGRLPIGIAYNPDNQAMYVAEVGSRGDGAIVAINSTSNAIIANITGAGPEPYGIAYDPNGNYMVVTCGASDCTNLFNATSNDPAGQVTVGSVLGNVGYDPANGDVYVLNLQSESLSVISRSS